MEYTITVVGLGPGGKDFLTIGALEKLKTGTNIILRTEKHPVVDYLRELKINYTTFDNLYEEMEDFEKVYYSITDKLLAMAEKHEVVYAVPGSPFMAEASVQLLQERALEKSVKLEFIPAVSFLEAVLFTLRKDPINGLQVIDGLQLDKQNIDTDKDTIITQVYNKMIASEVKIRLMNYFQDEQPVVIIRGAGIPNLERVALIKLYELDRIEWIDHLTSIYISKNDETTVKYYNMNNLLSIMERLRDRDGCQWDKKQTHSSLKPYLIEEAYEVLEALETKDMELLEEELGDLLLQVVFHAQIASESGVFGMTDVITGICKKLIYRHPHVFGSVKANSASDALESWEEMKRKEKDEKNHTDGLRRIPKYLPALMKSYKIQGKAANVGFDWENIEGAIEKVKEELDELLEVYKSVDKEKATEELGDLIFAVVNVSRFLKIEPEFALNKTVEKFIDRFEFIEMAAKQDGKCLEQLSLDEMNILWNLAKIHNNIKKYKK